jgi:hypothetical protein
MVLKVHRDTLNNMQRFWQCLMHKKVQFRSLSGAVVAMDTSARRAEHTYK